MTHNGQGCSQTQNPELTLNILSVLFCLKNFTVWLSNINFVGDIILS